MKDIIDAEDKFSNYLDEYWGSRWKNNLGVDFRSAMRSAKSLAEKAKVVSHLWDRCGYIECLYFEDNQPTAQCYNRRYTIADIIKKGGYLSVSSEGNKSVMQKSLWRDSAASKTCSIWK